MKPNAEARKNSSNKVIGEFTDEYVNRHNAMPAGNGRKISGTFPAVPNQSRDIMAPGTGEYDAVINIKDLE